MPERQRDPEKMLMRAKQEAGTQRGKLKIYLGAAPGVGKTYTMLSDAVSMRSRGLDVVAGVVESHGRKEIEEMLQDLEILPRKIVDYHGKPLLEFDLDAALQRNPGLILIDEMAHTNIPGLRHNKRWQDIKELIDRGINVNTTLNVQHIESLNNVITQISGIKVRETIPDSIIELADTIELVDLPPDDLLRRLQEGKVYIPAQAELASQNFFRKGNLTALRELALRYTAEYVDDQVLLHRKGQGIEQTWATTERLLVCIGEGGVSSHIVRAAKRMATRMHAEWIVVHVESPQHNISDDAHQVVIQNLRLAEQLGAETRILTAMNVVTEILKFAHERNVTRIILGKPTKPRWKELLFGSISEKLIRESNDIDIYIISSDKDKIVTPFFSKRAVEVRWLNYTIAGFITALTTLLNLIIYPYVGLSNIMLVYFSGIALVALLGRMIPVIFATVLSVFSYIFFFEAPRYSLTTIGYEYLITVCVMLGVAFIISRLSKINQQQASITQLGEQRSIALHSLTRKLASTRGTNTLLEIGVHYIASVFQSEVFALLPEENYLKVFAASGERHEINPKDEGLAQWVYDLGQSAGLGTDTLPYSDAVYVPLLGSHGPVGVLKVRPKQTGRLLIPDQLRLLEACANQIALALEVDRLQEQAKESQIAIETERLRTALFNSVSHELQTPLAVIVSLINNLRRKPDKQDAEAETLIEGIVTESERLNRLINNLLQVTKLEEGTIKLNKKLRSLEDLVKTSLNRVEKRRGSKPYVLNVSPNLPLVPFDKVLMEQVIVNLLENAILYTPSASPIEISISLEDDKVLISVADRGPGLKLEEVEKVFEKFYRGDQSSPEQGSGLGLSVCQSIVKAHGGKIWAENRWDGGAIFYVTLPLRESMTA